MIKCIGMSFNRIKGTDAEYRRWSDCNSKFVSITEKTMLEALKDTGVSLEYYNGNKRVGFIFGSSLGDINSINKGGNIMTDAIAYLCCKYKILGPVMVVSNTCVTGLSEIEIAKLYIESNIVDVCIVGSTEINNILISNGLKSLGILSVKKKCSPFSSDSDGICLGEGSAFLVLSNDNISFACCNFYGNILAVDTFNDCYSMIKPNEDLNIVLKHIENLLEKAKVKKDEILTVFTCANGVKYNDLKQLELIEKLFRGTKVYINTLKPIIGHVLGASTLIELFYIFRYIKQRKVEGNFSSDCDYIQQAQSINLQTTCIKMSSEKILLLSTGFSGVSGSIIVGG